ncbi:MAG: hypothetical protein KF805_05025 [Phycisphaeraceae bacterium]|nr:hypothetical protein [Phycisphaeraceae bacterium]
MTNRMHCAAALALMAGTIAMSASAQSVPLTDRPHYPLGAATQSLSPVGIEVANIGSSGNDGIVILPHPDTREMHVSLEGSGGGAGGQLKVKGNWNIKENTKGRSETMTANYLPGGLIEVSFDFHETNPSSLTAEYYFQGALVRTEEGLDPNPPGGPPTLRVFPGLISGIALDLSWRYYPGPPPRHGYNIGGPGWETGMTVGGTVINFDHVVLTAVTATPLVDSISSYEITTNAMPSFTITGETMTLGLACSGDLNSDGFVDDADFVEFAYAYDQLLCP